jgi:hypothetical protein
MSTKTTDLIRHPEGEPAQPGGELPGVEELSAVADTFGGLVRVEWDPAAPVTPLGQLPFFVDFLKQAGLFDAWVKNCPLALSSPNAPRTRDILGTLLLSTLAGHYRYAHVTALRCDSVNPQLLGMSKVVSEDSLRRNLTKIAEADGLDWLQSHLDYCTTPLLSEPWILDVDTTVKPLYGHQEGAAVGYNPHKPGRPSHSYHTYLISHLRLVLKVDVMPGNKQNVMHATGGLWKLLDHLSADRQPSLLRGDNAWGVERVMAEAEQRGLPYLFRLRLTKNVRGALDRAMRETDWTDAGQNWQGKETSLRLLGWSRQRRIILLRRKLRDDNAKADSAQSGKQQLSFPAVDSSGEVWEYGALVTSLDDEILTLGQLYRDRADCENSYDELKNQWGWGGFTTHDLKRCRFLANAIALVYNWWSLFVRLADPAHHREAITTRPLLLTAVARQTQHARQTTLTISSPHGKENWARRAYIRIARFLSEVRQNAEQLDPVQRWYRILSEAMRYFLKGRQLAPPLRLNPA